MSVSETAFTIDHAIVGFFFLLLLLIEIAQMLVERKAKFDALQINGTDDCNCCLSETERKWTSLALCASFHFYYLYY